MRLALIAIVGLLSGIVLFAPPGFRAGPAQAIGPEVVVSPTSGPAGSTFSLTGTGFIAGTSLAAFFSQLGAETPLGSVGVGPAGDFSRSLVVPSTAQPGDALVIVRDTLQTAQTTFQVTNGDGEEDPDDEAMCRIKVTLFGVTRSDPLGQTAQARLTSSVNLGIGRSDRTETLGGVSIILDDVLGERIIPKRLFPRRLQITSIVSSDGHGADHESIRINCPDSQNVVSVVRTFVLGLIPPDGGEPDDRDVSFEFIYKVEVTEVQ